MNKRWLRLMFLFVIFLAACDVEVNMLVGTDEDPPPAPDLSMEKLGVEKFLPQRSDTIYYNWNAACSIIKPWREKILDFANIINCYNDLSQGNVTFFASNTWFRKNDTAALYLTYDFDNSVFCELFVDPEDKIDRKRILWGSYDIDLTHGYFVLNNGTDSLLLKWTEGSSNVYNLKSFDYKDEIQIKYFWGFYTFYIYNEIDTTTILFDADNSGNIKAYKFFKDSLWHCWNEYFRNTSCY